MENVDERPAIVSPDAMTAKEWLRVGKTYLEDKRAWKDYEQAIFCLKRASQLGNSKADSLLESLKEDGLGIVVDYSAINGRDQYQDADSLEINDEDMQMRENLEFERDRCPSCGATVFRKWAHPDGGYVCSQDEGGCGTRLYLPIEEDGICAGFAIQPYKERLNPDVYSFFGRCIHVIKYDSSVNDVYKRYLIEEMVRRITECGVVENLLGKQEGEIALIVPAPSSKMRKIQLVYSLAQRLASDKWEYANLLRKHSGVESKDRPSGTELGYNEITCARSINGRTILLIDDTYGEGATLRACVRALKQSGAGEIFFMSLCRNIFGGMKGRA